MSLDHFNTFHVLPGNLLVIPDSDHNRSKGGIWFPDELCKKAQTGLCIQHAPAYLDEDLEQVRVLFAKWEWRTLNVRGYELYIVDERSVWAVFESCAMHPDQPIDCPRCKPMQEDYDRARGQ